MKLLLIAISLFSSLAALGERAQVRIDSIVMGEGKEDHLLLLEDGRVIFVPYTENLPLVKPERAVEINFNEDNILLSIQDTEYQPTILTELETAYQLYEKMRQDYKEEAQCYNMAHVWTYEEYGRSKLNSSKLFLFFTNKYIRKYRFHWWFHVTPLVLVKKESETNRIVLDRRYTSMPMDIKTWTNHFMVNKSECKEVNKFYDYYNFQNSEDCYLIQTSMYFWQPRDIRYRDNGRRDKIQYVDYEIKHAYKQGF